MSPLSSLPLVLLSISTILLSFPFNIDGLSTQTCPSYPTCGSVDIRYPFWLIDPSHNTTTSNCGYPGLGLSCGNTSKPPILHLSNDNDHYVTNINYKLATLTLVNVDFYGVPCPQPRHNLTLDDAHLFSFTKNDANLTFFLHCSRAPQLDGGFEPAFLSCIQNGSRTYATLKNLSVLGSSWSLVCKDSIVLSSVGKGVEESGLPQNFGYLLSTGFELHWTTPVDCARCADSGGECLHVKGSFSGCLCDNGEIRFYNCMNTGTIRFGLSLSLSLPPLFFSGLVLVCEINWS
ncbi:hypothetical protein QJS04_geneDACA003062 [Acorus gramineus]|uniref:Uncharacterized protein n=1 Tax=Acorus gramineus TaxID=55184 RepID=A0AAV9BWN6_ACOGR|nr:hypothetical protein QJS04_geneDACA003062 [Acorus gramineus]